jgi:putative tryptophan/tyrosine transport system substrate-binding protein
LQDGRREFIARLGAAGAFAVVPRFALAQQDTGVRRIAVLAAGDETTGASRFAMFRNELAKLGWVEGRNLRLDLRFGNGDATQTRVFAADLVQLAPDVIVAVYGAALRAVQQQTKTIPIVFIGAGDPADTGLARNTAHPEGNATGFANAFSSLGGKWLELLKEAAPNITRVAHLHLAGFAGSFLESVELAGQSLAVQVIAMPVSDAASVRAAIEGFAAEPNGGLVPSPSTSAIVPPDELSRLAVQYRLPAIYGGILPPGNGGLMSYGADPDEILRGVASYVDRLLRGAKVSDLPVQYPTKFRLAVNLKTAKTLGLTVPPALLTLADEVIE